MKRIQGWIGVLALGMLVSQSSMARAINGRQVCNYMPENNLHLFDNKASFAGITEEEFHKRIDQAEKLYKPIFDSRKVKLVIERNWDDPTVNAYADEQGSTWTVAMFGGLARRAEVTADGFSLVICHEIGHHLAGYPFYSGDWAAAEGQSDYFATQSCGKLLWTEDKAENAKFREGVNAAVKAKCDAAYAGTDEQNLCYRQAAAGLSLAKLLGALGREAEPKFETPDTRVVTRTSSAHPKGQCRLDTYFNGGLCKAEFDRMYIPGRGGENQTGTGVNTVDAEKDSDKYTCGGVASSRTGVRPACWFKSLVHSAAAEQ